MKIAAAGRAREADAWRVPRRLIAAGAAAVLLLAFGLVLAAIDAAGQVDKAAIDAEMARAERAVAAMTRDDGSLTGEDIHKLERDFSLIGARLVAASEVAASEVTIRVSGNAEGSGPLYLAWTPHRIGSEIFAILAPRRITISVLLIAVIGCILSWLSRTASVLDMHRRAARELAIRDALTGLANRRHFEEILRSDISGNGAAAAPFALLCLDLDGFKGVNDTMGHGAGDQLLRSIGERLAAMAAPGDLVARLGGDEFALIRRTGLDRDELAAFARSAILELCRPHAVCGIEISVGVSVGIALAPDHGQSAENLLSSADIALYQAKAQAGPAFAFAISEAERLSAQEAFAQQDAA